MSKSMRYPTCFICYAWGSEERYRRLEFLRNMIIDKAFKKIKVVLDRHSYEDNQDFDELRNKIWSYDLVIMICTPDLLAVINDIEANENKKREVSKEFKIVEERFKNDPNTVFPIIFEGTKESSLPELFSRKNAREYEKFGIYSKLTNYRDRFQYSVPKEKRNEFNIFIGKIIKTSDYNYTKKSEEYNSALEALNKLFVLTKTVDIPDSCLVIPDLYTTIKNQTCFLVVGRKGAGKSTFINNFSRMDLKYCYEHYKRIVPLSAEAFEHNFVYSTIVVDHKKEFSWITLYELLCLFWQVYFFLQCVVTIGVGIDCFDITTHHPFYKTFDSYIKKFKSELGLTGSHQMMDSDGTQTTVFRAAVEMISNHFNKAIDFIDNNNYENQDSCEEHSQKDKSSEDYSQNRKLILTSCSAQFTAQKIIESVFGESKTSDFIDAISHCEKRIMISFDAFDTHSEDFRYTTEALQGSDSEEYLLRTEYEKLFYRTMIEVVTKFKDHWYRDEVTSAMGKYIDFCIVLPKDRYDQIIKSDRDSFKKKFGSMSWTAYELLELLTKRLEYLIERITHKKNEISTTDYFIRMDEALSFFPGLPKTITMNVNGNKISMSLFNYILRSSFWRPRDVISNLSCLIALVVRSKEEDESFVKTSIKVSEEEVKLAIKDNAKRIIQEEFIKEYYHVFRNLDNVLKQFQGCDEQTDLYQFKSHLKRITFDTLFSYDMDITENKIRVLYQLGVIGLKIDKQDQIEKHYLHHMCFIFNEGMTPFEELIQDKSKVKGNISVIFNPIFTRHLMLNFNNNELIGDWSKQYILDNHKMKSRIEPL